MEVEDQNVQTNSLEMKDHNTQTEIVQIKDQQVQAESTTQQQGIKTASVAVLVMQNILAFANINTLKNRKVCVTCTNVTLL